jgi:hypothetical protein
MRFFKSNHLIRSNSEQQYIQQIHCNATQYTSNFTRGLNPLRKVLCTTVFFMEKRVLYYT